MSPLILISPLHRVSRQIGIYMDSRVQQFGIGGGECHLLAYLNSYAPCAVGELHRVFGLKRSTLTSMLDRLEERGWIQRKLDPQNRRSLIVTLTPDGKKTAKKIAKLAEDLEARLLEKISPQDLAGFQAVIDAVAQVTGVTVRPAAEEETR